MDYYYRGVCVSNGEISHRSTVRRTAASAMRAAWRLAHHSAHGGAPCLEWWDREEGTAPEWTTEIGRCDVSAHEPATALLVARADRRARRSYGEVV